MRQQGTGTGPQHPRCRARKSRHPRQGRHRPQRRIPPLAGGNAKSLRRRPRFRKNRQRADVGSAGRKAADQEDALDKSAEASRPRPALALCDRFARHDQRSIHRADLLRGAVHHSDAQSCNCRAAAISAGARACHTSTPWCRRWPGWSRPACPRHGRLLFPELSKAITMQSIWARFLLSGNIGKVHAVAVDDVVDLARPCGLASGKLNRAVSIMDVTEACRAAAPFATQPCRLPPKPRWLRNAVIPTTIGQLQRSCSRHVDHHPMIPAACIFLGRRVSQRVIG